MVCLAAHEALPAQAPHLERPVVARREDDARRRKHRAAADGVLVRLQLPQRPSASLVTTTVLPPAVRIFVTGTPCHRVDTAVNAGRRCGRTPAGRDKI